MAEVGLANNDPRVMWAPLARGDFYRIGSAMDRSFAARPEIKSITRLPAKGCEAGLTNADGEPVSSGV